jgi:hypothetical protein
VIRDLTESLQALLTQPGLPTELANAAIRFDRPTDPYAPDQTTLNLYLYEVREDLALRSNEPEVRRVGAVSTVVPPPRRVGCTYLVTAWPVGGSDLPQQEHRLLSQALRLFAATPLLPAAFQQGSLIGQEPPPPLEVVQPDGIRNPAEFWAAIGNRARPCLLVSVTVAMPILAVEAFPAVVSAGFEVNGAVLFRIAGVVTDAASAPVAAATVRLIDRGRTTTTNARGEFTLAAVPPGAYTLRAAAGLATQDKAITVPAPTGSDYNVQFP